MLVKKHGGGQDATRRAK